MYLATVQGKEWVGAVFFGKRGRSLLFVFGGLLS